MESDFAAKLRLTATALGCSGRKDLCARFRAVNPATHFDVERSSKWLQGRALPRSVQMYDDWAKVLGTQRSGAWLASCTVEAFLEEICKLYSADADTLRHRADERGGDGVVAAPAASSASGYLCGSYACYSLAWSPYYRGHLIRGALTIGPGRRTPALAAVYSEAVLGTEVRFEGEVLPARGTVHLSVCNPEGRSPLFVSLFLPGPPASVLCGVMSGATIIGPEALPSTTRMVVVRVPGNAGGSNRYLSPAPGALSDDLLALGLDLAEASEVDALMREFLLSDGEGGLDQVAASDQVRLTSVLDRAYLRAGDRGRLPQAAGSAMLTPLDHSRAGESGATPPPKAQPAPGNAQAEGPRPGDGPLESRRTVTAAPKE